MLNEYLHQPGQQSYPDLEQQVNVRTSNPVSNPSNIGYDPSIIAGYGTNIHIGTDGYKVLTGNAERGTSQQRTEYIYSDREVTNLAHPSINSSTRARPPNVVRLSSRSPSFGFYKRVALLPA